MDIYFRSQFESYQGFLLVGNWLLVIKFLILTFK